MAKKKASADEKPKKALSKDEVEKLIVDLANKEVPSAKIGLILKNEYGVPKAKYAAGKIEKVLARNKIVRFPKELQNLIDKAKKLRKHFAKNKKDMSSKRGILVTEAKIRKKGAYFRKKKLLDADWEYKAE